MATLTGKSVASTYKDVLKINSASDNAGIDATLRAVEDGDATTSALKISSGAIQVDNIKIDGNTISSEDANGDIALMPNGTGKVGIGVSDPDESLEISGSLKFGTDDKYIYNSSGHKLMRIRASGIVINEDGIYTCDFRVESDTSNTAFLVDASEAVSYTHLTLPTNREV